MKMRKQKPGFGSAIHCPFLVVVGMICVFLVLIAPACHSRQISGSHLPSKKAAARKPADFYAKNIRDDLFTAPSKRKSVPATAPNKKTTPVPALSPAAPDPLADWVYSGTVSIGDEKIALLENTKTHEGVYLRRGDAFMGKQIGAITDDGIVVDQPGKSYTIAKSDKYNLVPLDKNATFVDEEKAREAALLAQADKPQSVTDWVLSIVGSATSPDGNVSSFLRHTGEIYSEIDGWISSTRNDGVLILTK